MLDNKKVLAVIPARGGSKGVPKKNLRILNGRPIVCLAGEVARATPEIDRCIVSTDSDEIITIVNQSGLSAPFKRPAEISSDLISDWDVLNHALVSMEKIDNIQYDIIVMLQPTSPFRTPKDISTTIKILVDGNFDAVWSVSETDSKSHPLKQLVILDGCLDYWDVKGKDIIARQQLKPVYSRNGVAYAITRDCLLKQKTIKGKKTGFYIVKNFNISIDTEIDFLMAEFFLKKL